jgi:hypothetical protein
MQITGRLCAARETSTRMVKEAESHAEEDRKRHVSVELRNEADNLPYREATQRERPQDHRRERNGGGVHASGSACPARGQPSQLR